MAVDLINPEKRNTELEFLHSVFRTKLEEVMAQLAAEEIPLFVFEAYRSPVRQTHLFAKGRTIPDTKKVTNARAWESYHQYGLAVDLVFHGPGKWSWDEPERGMWDRMHAIAAEHGLEHLSFETPHIQITGTSGSRLRAGAYPPGGDETWAENIAGAIAIWRGEPSAPPRPSLFERPPLVG